MTTEALATPSDSSWVLEKIRGKVELYITPIFFGPLALTTSVVWMTRIPTSRRTTSSSRASS